MPVIRSGDRPVEQRPSPFPTLQRLVDRTVGAEAMTVLVNEFTGDELVPVHTHDVEEILVVTGGRVTVSLGGSSVVASAGDAVVVPPGVTHGMRHEGPGEARVVAVLASPDAMI